VAGVGLASYSIYLYQEVFVNEHYEGGILKYKLLIFAFAALSYFLVEKPAIRFGKQFLLSAKIREARALDQEPAL
jgi:peptidoglycan/LPS O-acetylase OafA/YrhL